MLIDRKYSFLDYFLHMIMRDKIISNKNYLESGHYYETIVRCNK